MDNNLLSARVNDLKFLCQKANSPKFMGFLTAEEVSAVIGCLKNGENYSLFGGYDDAERVMMAFLPDWCDEPVFPIKGITFTFRKCDTLSHRDFLGALMSLGIARETVGDILIGSGQAVVFVTDDVSKYVFTQIEKIGNVGVELSEGFTLPLPQCGQKQSFSVTVASTRLDCIVAALCGISRNQALEKIECKEVAINSATTQKATACIKAEDKITIRKKGKYFITSCDELSKKGRVILRYDKYI